VKTGLANYVTTWYAYDQQGTVTQRFNADGSFKNAFACDAFGNKLAGTQDTYSYNAKSGYYYDSETEFYYCTHRYYDPKNGRWLTEDPIGFEGGLNLYGYCGNGPVGSVDPEGNWSWTVKNGLIIGSDNRPWLQFTGENTVEGAQVGMAAVGSSFSFGIWDGGKWREDPAFKTSKFFADIGRDAALTAITLGFGEALAAGKFGANGKKVFDILNKAEKAAEKLLSKMHPSDIRAIRSFGKKITEHIEKLDQYIKNPLSMDNKGFLRKAIDEKNWKLVKKIKANRIKCLLEEIDMYYGDIQKIFNKYK
jgi:RHS repeat-associated protein